MDGAGDGVFESGGEVGAGGHIQAKVGEEDDEEQNQGAESQALADESQQVEDGRPHG